MCFNFILQKRINCIYCDWQVAIFHERILMKSKGVNDPDWFSKRAKRDRKVKGCDIYASNTKQSKLCSKNMDFCKAEPGRNASIFIFAN